MMWDGKGVTLCVFPISMTRGLACNTLVGDQLWL